MPGSDSHWGKWVNIILDVTHKQIFLNMKREKMLQF